MRNHHNAIIFLLVLLPWVMLTLVLSCASHQPEDETPFFGPQPGAIARVDISVGVVAAEEFTHGFVLTLDGPGMSVPIQLAAQTPFFGATAGALGGEAHLVLTFADAESDCVTITWGASPDPPGDRFCGGAIDVTFRLGNL